MTPVPIRLAATTTVLYDFSSSTAEPPTGNQIRFDAGAPYTAVTRLWMRNLTADGIDIHAMLMGLAVGETLYIQDKNDHAAFVTVDTTGAPVNKTDYVEVPAAWVGNGTALNGGQQVLVAIIPPDTAPPSPTPGPFLTLQEAKDHLRITTPAGHPDDVDIQAKLDAAQAIILDYCNTTATWRDVTATWTAATVPQPVTAAMLLELGELMRFRGDDLEAPERQPDTDLSPQIVGLLRRSRDPVIA